MNEDILTSSKTSSHFQFEILTSSYTMMRGMDEMDFENSSRVKAKKIR